MSTTSDHKPTSAERDEPLDFVRQMVRDDVEAGKHGGRVQTRFPPEPNGYLHIGHAKAICIVFGVAAEFGGKCNLRFDDTNPETESTEFVDAIQDDIRWLGFDWEDRLYFASDYFEKLYDWACHLIDKGLAYVDDQSVEEMRAARGTVTEAGTPSPYRDRSPAENRELFERMRNGDFDEGACVLRAKIDMASPNMHLRDPVMYRIKKAHHHRTGDAWCIYPTYDWAHGQGDSIEEVTHSLCTLEFEIHRPLYEWFLDNIDGAFPSRQTEFARLNLTHTITSKRKLKALVDEGIVTGWDDPRMPTLRGMRRRGYTPEAIRKFCDHIGVSKYNSQHESALLDFVLREDLNKRAQRRMAVLDPIKLIIENWPEGKVDELDAINNPEDESAGKRKVPFGGELWIERDDFMEDPPKKFFRLAPGREVRLRYAYFVTCTGVDKDADGNVVAVRCTYDPESRGGNSPDGRKVKGTIHWVSAEHTIDAELRIYEQLFEAENPSDVPDDGDWRDGLNPESLTLLANAKLEPSLRDATPDEFYQFERKGYFVADRVDHTSEAPVFNRTVGLRDSWKKQVAKQKS